MDNSTPEMSQKLVLYLDGELSGKEKEELEASLATDPVLQQELENLQLAREAVRVYGLKQKVTSVHEEMMEEMKVPVRQLGNRRRITRYVIGIAASILLIYIGIEGYSFYNLSSEKVFAANYHTYELSTVRAGGTEEKQIEKAYRAKEYTEVIRLGEQSQDARDIFLVALAHTERKEYPAAIDNFKKVIALDNANDQALLRDEAEYYLALAYISNKDYNAALAILEKIRDTPSHLYSQRVSAKLIRQVKRLKWK